MQVPLKWLRDYVDIDMDVNELADLLTMTGTKVEGISKVGAELKDIVAGYVIDKYQGIPSAGETILSDNKRIKILRTNTSRIELMRVTIV